MDTSLKNQLIKAVKLAQAGEWDASHRIASSKNTTMQQPAGYMPYFTKLKAMKSTADIGMRAVMPVLKTMQKLAKNLK